MDNDIILTHVMNQILVMIGKIFIQLHSGKQNTRSVQRLSIFS